MISSNIKMAMANLRVSKWRTFFTMFGIIVGISSVVTVVSLGEGLKNQVVGQINSLGTDVITIRSGKIVNRDESGKVAGVNLLAFLSAGTLTDKDATKIGQLNSVATAVPMSFLTNNATAEGHELNNLFVIGTSADMNKFLQPKIAYGQFFGPDELDQNYAIIGPRVAHSLYQRLNPVGYKINISGTEFAVRGVLENSSGGLLSAAQTDYNSAVFIPLPAATRLSANRAQILQILARAKDPNNLNKSVDDIHTALLANHNGSEDFTVLKQDELLQIADDTVNTIAGFSTGVAAISLIVGGIGIMNILMVSVSERTREVGIRKAIGASNRQILVQFLTEGLALTLTGGIIGVLLSLAISGLLRVYTSLHPAFNIPVMLSALYITVLVGVIFSIVPALKAARKPPIEALRGE